MQVAPDATGTGLPGQSGDARVAIGSAPHRCRRLAFVPAFHLKPPVSAQFPSPRGHGFPAAATVLYVEAGRVIRIYQPVQVPKLCKSPTSAARPAQQSNLRSGLADGHFRGHFEGLRPARLQERWQALSEAARSVGGGASIGQSQVAQSAAGNTEPAAGQLIGRILQASKDLDPIELQAQLDLAATHFGLARCVDEILMPATRHMKQLLTTGQRDAPQDRLAMEAVRTWLNYRGAFAPPPQEIGPIVLACGPRDRDPLTLESLALLLRFQRWPCRVLGARVPTLTLTIAAQAADASGVVVISTQSRNRRHAIVSLLAVDALGIPAFFAGEAFEPEQHRTDLPGRYLGTRIEGARTLLGDTLARDVQRRCR